MSRRPLTRSRSSDRTPTLTLDEASHAQLNAGTSYRVQLDEGIFSLTAKQAGDRAYYYVTKRVRGHLFKVYVAANGEVTAYHIQNAVRAVLAEIEVSEQGQAANHKQGESKMRRKNELNDMAVVGDLLNAFEVVLKASGEEQVDLYEVWRESSTQILALIVSPEGHEAWRAFASQPIEWSSETKASLQLGLIRAYLRALVGR